MQVIPLREPNLFMKECEMMQENWASPQQSKSHNCAMTSQKWMGMIGNNGNFEFTLHVLHISCSRHILTTRNGHKYRRLLEAKKSLSNPTAFQNRYISLWTIFRDYDECTNTRWHKGKDANLNWIRPMRSISPLSFNTLASTASLSPTMSKSRATVEYSASKIKMALAKLKRLSASLYRKKTDCACRKSLKRTLKSANRFGKALYRG